MTNSFHSLSIDQELANIKIDSHWDDDTIISFYNKNNPILTLYLRII